MNDLSTLRRLALPLLALSLSIGVAACDNPVEEEHEDHPVGLILVDAQGQTAASISEGPTVTGQLTVPAGGSRTYQVFAVGEDGDRIAMGGEIEVRVASQPQNATLTVENLDRLVITGRTAGAGSARIELWHEGHPELGDLVPVVVTP
jgi:hypothetical protein